MRLFFALWPPPRTAEALARWASGLDGKAVPARNIHLTLAFLGDAEPDRAIEAGRRVRAVAHELPLDEARYVRRNQMVWARPREAPAALMRLAAGLKDSLAAASFALEERPFAAHVTLVRKARTTPRSLPPLPPASWPVGEFVLVASTPMREGSRYERLAAFALDG